MVIWKGFKTYVQYDEETSYGTGATPATAIVGKIQTVSVDRNNNLIRKQGVGEGRNDTFIGWGNFEATWSIEYEIADFAFLQFAIGAMDGSGTTAAPYFLEEKDFMDYTATSKYGLKSFGMEVSGEDVSGTDDTETIAGCVIEDWSISANVGGTVRCSTSGFARTCVSSASATAFTPTTTKPWIFAQGNFKWNGSTVARVNSWTINGKNGFTADNGRQLGSRFIEEVSPGLRTYDFVVVAKMTNTIASTLRDHFYGQANSPNLGVASSEPTFYDMIFELSEGATSGLRNAQILLSNCAINDISKPINVGDGMVEITLNGCGKNGTLSTTNRPIKWWTAT